MKKAVFVTGGTVGTGLVTAEKFAAAGYNVVITSREAARAEAAAAQVAQARQATGNTRLTHFEWLSEGVSVSTFANGAVICVNDSNADITWQGQHVPAGAWLAGKEAAE